MVVLLNRKLLVKIMQGKFSNDLKKKKKKGESDTLLSVSGRGCSVGVDVLFALEKEWKNIPRVKLT